LSFHPCNILRDSRRGVSMWNKNVGCGTWKRRFFSRSWIISKRSYVWIFLPSGSHTILVYRSYTDTNHRAATLRQQSFWLRTAAHIFVSQGDAPATMTKNVAWMERQFNACRTPCSMYLSIFDSFRVIRCLSQCLSPKIAIFATFFVSPGDAPVAITQTLDEWKDNLVLAKSLAACTIQQFSS